jgi:hypothetical protein
MPAAAVRRGYRQARANFATDRRGREGIKDDSNANINSSWSSGSVYASAVPSVHCILVNVIIACFLIIFSHDFYAAFGLEYPFLQAVIADPSQKLSRCQA